MVRHLFAYGEPSMAHECREKAEVECGFPLSCSVKERQELYGVG